MIDMTKAELEKELNDYMEEGARNERGKIIDFINKFSDFYYESKTGPDKEELDAVEVIVEYIVTAISTGMYRE